MEDAAETKQQEEEKKQFQTEQTYFFEDKGKIMTIDALHSRYRMGYYNNIESLQEDLKALIERTIRTRCKNELAKKYLE